MESKETINSFSINLYAGIEDTVIFIFLNGKSKQIVEKK